MRIKILKLPKAQVGIDTDVPIAELEQGEVYKATDGSIKKIGESGNRHEDGGEIVDDASQVLEDTSDKRKDIESKLLKISKEEIEEATGVKVDKDMTHSKAFEVVSEYYAKKAKRLENKLKKNLEHSKKFNSTYARNSMDINQSQLESIPSDDDIFNTLFSLQEMKKQNLGIGQEYSEDEIPMAAYGTNLLFNKGLESAVNYAKSIPNKNSLQNTNTEKKFNEPLRWYDLAGPIKAIMDSSSRVPTNYYPTESFQVSPRLMSAAPYLQEGQSDYNAALAMLPDNQIGYANAANLFARKYQLNNQALGNVQNQNAEILMRADQAEAARKNQQSINDVGARQNFEDRWLGSLEAQRNNFNAGLETIASRYAANNKLNREGDLIMQMYKYFDQFGRYNGNQFNFGQGSSSDYVEGAKTMQVKGADGKMKNVTIVPDSKGKYKIVQ